MTLIWLNHLFTTLVVRLLFLLTLWLLSYAWRAWKQFRTWERRYQRFLERQRRAQQRAQHALPGLPRPPKCSACRAEPTQPALRVPTPPPVWTKSSLRGRHHHIQPTWQACPFEACAYYGWPGLGNLTANGHPNHGRPRQWLCQACHGFFIETRGTVFYRRREVPQFVRQVLTSLAEGLNAEATARLHRVQVETVETWFTLSTTQFEQLAVYLYRNLQVEQVELDDLFIRLRAVQSATGSPRRCAWLYNAFDPVTKFWLAFSLGDRSLSPSSIWSTAWSASSRLAACPLS